MKKLKRYAMYKGDEFIDLGTAKELAQRHNTTISTIYWYIYSSAWKKKRKDNWLLIVPMEEED